MKRGKKITNAQRKILQKNGHKNTEDFLYVSQETVKGISKIDHGLYLSPVKIKLKFINKVTNEVVICDT